MLRDTINSEKLKDYWRNIDKNILFSFLSLFFLGIFFSFSSTSSLAGERLNKDFYHYFSRHLIFSIIAIILMFTISYVKISFLKKTIFPIFVFSIILLILVPFIGVEIKGAKRWLDLSLFRLQPIEIVKPFFVLVIAGLISNQKNKFTLYSFFELISFIFHCNFTCKSTRCWPVNITNHNLDINNFHFWN